MFMVFCLKKYNRHRFVLFSGKSISLSFQLCLGEANIVTHCGSDISIECDRIVFTCLAFTGADPGEE